MSVIPKITCRRCGREYSGLRSRCPYCGTGRSKSAERIPLRTSSENAGTPAAEHAAVNTKWQMLFGGILLLAVVAAVIVLITVSLNASQNTPSAAEPTPRSVSELAEELDELGMHSVDSCVDECALAGLLDSCIDLAVGLSRTSLRCGRMILPSDISFSSVSARPRGEPDRSSKR